MKTTVIKYLILILTFGMKMIASAIFHTYKDLNLLTNCQDTQARSNIEVVKKCLNNPHCTGSTKDSNGTFSLCHSKNQAVYGSEGSGLRLWVEKSLQFEMATYPNHHEETTSGPTEDPQVLLALYRDSQGIK